MAQAKLTVEEYKEFLRVRESDVEPGEMFTQIISIANGKLTVGDVIDLICGDTSVVEGAESWGSSLPPGYIPAVHVEDIVEGKCTRYE